MAQDQSKKAEENAKVVSDLKIDMARGVVSIVAVEKNGIALINQVPAMVDFDQVLDLACTLIMHGVRARQAKKGQHGVLVKPSTPPGVRP